MIQTNVQLNLDKKQIQAFIEQQISETVKGQLWLIDLEKLSELTSMSKRFLEDEIISDVRMKSIEIRKNRKRWWKAKEAFEITIEIVNEW